MKCRPPEEISLSPAQVLEHVADPVLVLDECGIITFTNPAMDASTGFQPGELIGKPIFLLYTMSPEAAREHLEHVVRQIKARRFTRSEHEIRRKDGTALLVETRTSGFESGGRLYLVVVGRDIAEQKRVAAALREASSLNQQMLAASVIGILAYKASGECVFANQAMVQIAGGSVEKLLEGNFLRNADWRQSGLLLLAKETLLDGAPRSGVFTATTRFGKTVWVDVHLVRFTSGGELHLLCMARDITAQRRLEQQLLEISDREQASMGQEVHDGLCQHLVSVAFDATSLERQLVAEGHPEAATARRLSNFLDKVITESRQLARGLFPIRLEANGLTSALEQLACSLEERFHIRCEFVSRQQVLIENATVATHLYRIAQEAVRNALQHAQARNILICLQEQAAAFELTVEDDGKGIDLTGSRKASSMGLCIMDYRARSIGGKLRVSSRPQGGTVVSCRVPRQ